MQAFYSGFSYISSEVRRATQPIIETLAPILPTFGFGEAEVKQSLGTCLHQMEAVSAANGMQHKGHPLWYENHKNIKQIMLYPATRLSQLNQEQGCRIPNTSEWANWYNVTSNINQQLENWAIPFRFNISTQAAKLDDVSSSSIYNQCLVISNANDSLLANFVRHCDKLVVNGRPVGGSLNGCLITILTDMPKSTYAHELAHIVSSHPFEAIPLSSLHPDVLEAMCDSVAHDNELITSLSYWSHCKNMGFTGTSNYLDRSRGEWGPIDLTLAKLAAHRDNNATHAQIHAEGVDKSYEWIKQNYGERAAEQFAASFAKSVVIHSMSAIVARTVKDKLSLVVSRGLIHMFANLIHLGMMGQLNSTLWLSAGHFCAGSGLMGKTVKALVGVIGEAAILSTFVRLIRGNSNSMMELVYATCGTTSGNLFSTMIISFIDQCAPTDQSQRDAYLDLTKTTTLYGVLAETGIFQRAICDEDPITNSENISSHLPTIIQCIASIDAAVSDVIENYVSLRVMTTWLWKTDEQKADAQVRASVDRLSDTLDKVSIEYGSSDPPHITAYIGRFQAAQTVPDLEPLESVEDDPSLFVDGAAVTGIGNASLYKHQQVPQAKKLQ